MTAKIFSPSPYWRAMTNNFSHLSNGLGGNLFRACALRQCLIGIDGMLRMSDDDLSAYGTNRAALTKLRTRLATGDFLPVPKLAAAKADGSRNHSTVSKVSVMRLSSVCFVYATLCVIAGMSLGIWMGVSEDHSLGPVHAHLNVLGWLSMAVIGLYLRATGRASTRIDRAQVITLGLGIPALVGGIAVFMLPTDDALLGAIFPLALAGTFLCLGSMILFLVIVIRDGRRPA